MLQHFKEHNLLLLPHIWGTRSWSSSSSSWEVAAHNLEKRWHLYFQPFPRWPHKQLSLPNRNVSPCFLHAHTVRAGSAPQDPPHPSGCCLLLGFPKHWPRAKQAARGGSPRFPGEAGTGTKGTVTPRDKQRINRRTACRPAMLSRVQITTVCACLARLPREIWHMFYCE